MREVIEDVQRWREEGEQIALATVIATWGSAPRKEGAKMALTPSGKISGSVSGGCVEGAVYESGLETLETGQAQLLEFGVADETAWDVGLACGGHIKVFVEPMSEPGLERIQQWLHAEESAATVTVVSGPNGAVGQKVYVAPDGEQYGTIEGMSVKEVAGIVENALNSGGPIRHTLSAEPGELELFVDALLPSPTLLIIGGAHIAIALASIARTVGYHTILVDPRRAFGNVERFPHVDRLIQAWPDEALEDLTLTHNTAVATLTHDPKIDDPALIGVLAGPAFYVGALGSTSTHERRRKRLLEAGVTPEQIERIHSPIGLDINSQTPEEIAVAIMAEIVAARRGAEI